MSNNGNALTIVKAAKERGALIFANIENMEAKVDLYRTEVTEITFQAADFHTINGKKVPTKAATDRIGEACGIQLIESACTVNTETRDDASCGKRTVYCAVAQGKVRMPDGSWRTSTADEYEFDPVLRAMLDKNINELTPQTRQIVGKPIMEYSKVARQRAATGARLRVIRQLTGMPSAFEPAEATKPMVFTRVVQNTDYILNTEVGRAMATAQALGVDVASLFGKPKLTDSSPMRDVSSDDVPPSNETPPDNNSAASMAAQAAAEEPDFPDEPTGPGTSPEKAEFDRLTNCIVEFIDGYKSALDVVSKNGKNPLKMAEDELNNPDATIETRKSMIDRLRTWLNSKGYRV